MPTTVSLPVPSSLRELPPILAAAEGFPALMDARQQLAQQRRRLRVGAAVGLEELTTWLVERGYQRMEAVELPGEFSRRGGILDVFSPDAEAPYRLEFLGDDVESIRQFAADTQRSLGDVQTVEITAASGGRWTVDGGRWEKDGLTNGPPSTVHRPPSTDAGH